MAQTGGRRVEIEVDGRVVVCLTIGGLARALNRSPRTIRGWERSGLIPPAPFILEPNAVSTRRRLYPVEMIEILQRATQSERFGRRRPSGRFLRQQEILYNAWNTALEPFRQSDDVMSDESREPLT